MYQNSLGITDTMLCVHNATGVPNVPKMTNNDPSIQKSVQTGVVYQLVYKTSSAPKLIGNDA